MTAQLDRSRYTRRFIWLIHFYHTTLCMYKLLPCVCHSVASLLGIKTAKHIIISVKVDIVVDRRTSSVGATACSSSSSSSCGLSGVERSRSHESTPCLTVLVSSIGGCQTNVERCKVRLHRPEPCMTGSAGRTIPVSWQGARLALRARLCSMDGSLRAIWPKKLETTGAGNMSEWPLVSTTADLFVGDAGPPWDL